MAIQKSKKKKASKKNKSDKEWSHEGGQMSSRSHQTDVTGPIRVKRQSQESDERMRRGLRKVDKRKQERLEAKKMHQKVSFTQIAVENVLGQSTPSLISGSSRRVRQEPPRPLTPLEVLKRFQSSSLKRNNDNLLQENSTDSDEDINESEIDDLDSKVPVICDDTKLNNFDLGCDVTPAFIQCYKWFVCSQTTRPSSTDSSILETCANTIVGNFYGWVHPSISLTSTESSTVTTYSPNSFERQLLQYLKSYCDLFIEGSGPSADATLTHVLSYHLTSHIVLSR
jgi:hypothetical protein